MAALLFLRSERGHARGGRDRLGATAPVRAMPLGEDFRERLLKQRGDAGLDWSASALASHDLRHHLSRLAKVFADTGKREAGGLDGMTDLDWFHIRGVVTLHVKLPCTLYMTAARVKYRRREMHAEDIKAALRKAQISMADIGRDLDVSRAAVGSVVDGKSRSQRVETAIAAALGLRLSDVWPHWYGGATEPEAIYETRLPALDLDLLGSIEQAYWNAAAARGDDPILPLASKHIGRLYNRCAEQLTRSADASAKFAVAVREIAYLVEMDHLPRFDVVSKSSAEKVASQAIHNHGSGQVANNQFTSGGTVKIDMRRKKPG